MDILVELQEKWGQEVVIPFSNYVRVYFEGENAPRHDSWETQWYYRKEVNYFDPTLLSYIILIAIIFTITEKLLRSVLLKILLTKLKLPESDATRCTESTWQFLFYLSSWIFSCVIVWDSPWFYDTYLCWEDPFPNQDPGLLVYILFVVQTGWYVHCAWCHIITDVNKSDYWVMLTHHIAALILLYFAFITGRHRVGVLCLFTLDICDVFLHFTKSVRLLDNTLRLGSFSTTASYLALVFSWIYFRLWLYVKKVLYTSSFQGMHYGGWLNSEGWCFYNCLLLLIYIFQVYWFYLIILSGYKFVRFGTELDDERDPTAKNEKLKEKKT